MEERNPLADAWPAISIAAVVTVSILVTVLWMQRQETRLLKGELTATKMELLDSQTKRLNAVTTLTPTKTTVEEGAANVGQGASQEEIWSGDWTVRNTDYGITKPNYRLECVGHEASRDIKRTRLVKLVPEGPVNMVEDVAKAGMDVACDSVIWILEPKGSSKVYFMVYEPPSVGPVYVFDVSSKKFTLAEAGFFAGRRLDYVISPDQRYLAQVGPSDAKNEVSAIRVYDLLKDEVREVGRLKPGESYTKSLKLFNTMASGESAGELGWAPNEKLSAEVFSSKAELKEAGTCGVQDNPDYECFERTPIRSVELAP